VLRIALAVDAMSGCATKADVEEIVSRYDFHFYSWE